MKMSLRSGNPSLRKLSSCPRNSFPCGGRCAHTHRLPTLNPTETLRKLSRTSATAEQSFEITSRSTSGWRSVAYAPRYWRNRLQNRATSQKIAAGRSDIPCFTYQFFPRTSIAS